MLISASLDTGKVRALNTDLIDLRQIGERTIRRASHVEPITEGPNRNRWFVDLSPICAYWVESPVGFGACLGPFDTHVQAIAAEIEWLEEHWIRKSYAQYLQP